MSKHKKTHEAILGFFVDDKRVCIENTSLENLVYAYNQLVMKKIQVRDFVSISFEVAEKIKASVANGIFAGLIKVRLDKKICADGERETNNKKMDGEIIA